MIIQMILDQLILIGVKTLMIYIKRQTLNQLMK